MPRRVSITFVGTHISLVKIHIYTSPGVSVLLTSFVSTVFQYAIPVALLLPIILTWKRYREFFSINADLKKLKHEYRTLGQEYKKSFREYSISAQCDNPAYDGWGNNGWLDSVDRAP